MPERRLRPHVVPWMRDALCIEYPQEWWFLDGPRQSAKKARSVCHRCLVRQECLAYAIEHNEKIGVWGGFADHDLQKWRTAHRQSPCRRCRRRMPVMDIAAAVIAGIERGRWCCSECQRAQLRELGVAS